jgi:hypothetical protein
MGVWFRFGSKESCEGAKRKDEMTKRRKYTRRQINQPVTYTIVLPAGAIAPQGTGLAQDLCPGGMMVESAEAISLTSLTIKNALSDGVYIETSAAPRLMASPLMIVNTDQCVPSTPLTVGQLSSKVITPARVQFSFP